MAANRRSFAFYPSDWLKDPNLRRCSPAARGVWADLLCLMFESEEEGHLIADGKPWPREDIAAAVGGEPVVVLRCLDELVDKNILHTDDRGAFFSSRLAHQAEQRRKRRERRLAREQAKAQADATPEAIAVPAEPAGSPDQTIELQLEAAPPEPPEPPEPPAAIEPESPVEDAIPEPVAVVDLEFVEPAPEPAGDAVFESVLVSDSAPRTKRSAPRDRVERAPESEAAEDGQRNQIQRQMQRLAGTTKPTHGEPTLGSSAAEVFG